MVSEKLVVILLIAAIVLSVISVAVTFSAINSKLVPQININPSKGEDSQQGKIILTIEPPANPPKVNQG